MGEPAWSPDGRYLLYSAGKQHYRSIYLWDAAANKSYRVTTPETNDHHSKPQWVTRAEGLLVATSAPPKRQVSIRLAPVARIETSLEGGGPPYHWINKRYQWAKDGSFFALTTPFFSLIDSQGKTRNFNFGARMARVSPDGRQVAIVDGTGLAVMDLGTEKQRQVIASGQGETIRTAAWSYTGNSVFVVTGKKGNPDAADTLERVDIRTGQRQTVFSGQVVWTRQMIRVEIYPSPTADDLALAIGETVWILPAGSEKPRLVSRSPAYNPAWSPDGKFLAFQEQVLKDRDYAIKVVDHTGLNLIEVGEGNNPQWLGNDTLVYLDNYDKRVMAIPSGGGIPTEVLRPLPGEKIVAIATSSSGGRLAVLLERTGEKNRLDFYRTAPLLD
jgi:WD40 repeat protein